MGEDYDIHKRNLKIEINDIDSCFYQEGDSQLKEI